MVVHYGFLIDIGGKVFDDTQPQWIDAFPFGTYDHPIYGTIEMNAEKAAEFVNNIKNNVRGQDLDIDYDHKKRTDEAAGWVKDARVGPTGLQVAVQWTKTAAQKIKEKAYRYFSPEYADEWKNPTTGVKHKNVMFGGGITNRPFLKGIAPINMSEVFDSVQKEGVGMDPKRIRELLGLSEDASDTDVEAALKAKNDPPQNDPPQNEPPAPPTAPTGQLSEDALKQLAETNPVIKSLMERQAQQERQLAEQQAVIRLGEINTQLTEANDVAKAKHRSIPPAVLDEVRGIMVGAPKQLSDQFGAALKKLAEVGFVELGERGRSGGDSQTTTASKRFAEEVDKVLKSNNKLTYADAVELVSKENEQLFDEYREESFAFREV